MNASDELARRLAQLATRNCPTCDALGQLFYLRILSSYVVCCEACGAVFASFEAYHDDRGRLELRHQQGVPI